MAKRSLIDAALEGFQRLSGEFDPRYDPRVKEQERLRNLSLQVQERGTQDAPRIPLTDLEGRGFVTTMSDRTRAGGLLTGINDTELSYPVNLQGGQGYMFENPGQVWASAPSVVNQIMKEAGKVRSSTGQEPAYIPFRMAPTGGDFAKKTGETMLSYASASMNKKNKKSLDRSMKQFIPDWLGVDNPDSIAQYRAMSDKKRKAIKQMLDRDFRDKGGLNIGEARLAVSDPSQINAKDAGVQNVGQIFTDRPTIVGSGHPSYPFGVPGEGLGTLNRDIGIFDLLPDVVRERGIPDPSVPRQTDIRALQMKPYSGVIDETLLKDLEARGININSPAYAGLLAAITASAMEEGTNNYVIPQASELLAQQDRQREDLLSQIDPVEQRVQQLMQPLAQEPGYNYGDILPIKRSTDPARREEFPYGIEPAIPNMARGLLEEAVRAYEMNRAGRQREATQSALGLLF